jgi:hypothetical protein
MVDEEVKHMEQWKQICYTVARVFIGTVLAAFVLDVANLMNFNWADWKPIIYAAVAAAVVVVLNALNWNDPRYGIGAGETPPS